MTRTVMFGCQKGGVGKTTAVVQTAAALARRGNNVLVVDMDPQANATKRLGYEYDPNNPTATASEAIAANAEGAGAGAVYSCGWTDADGNPTEEAEHIDLIPGRGDLLNRESEVGQVGAVRRLIKALTGWTEAYDYILIDTAPSLGHLVQMSMAVADAIVVVTEPEDDGVGAAINTTSFAINHAIDLANPGLAVAGVIVNRRRETGEHVTRFDELQQTFTDKFWNLRTTEEVGGIGERELSPSWIPLWSVFSDANSFRVSLTSHVITSGKKKQAVALFDQVALRIEDYFEVKEKAE